ncbi:MAG: hypothetical protein WBN83_05360 [Desulfoprunum sp.]|uniref:DUF2958 domain-containing protein n=1 Tax=Desulfoprunum sp. TaxID=2020866 RepID=UPI003C78DD21
MLNTPTATRLARLPRLYQTENTPISDKLIHLHFFIGSCDWFIAEYDGDDLFFGFAVLGGDWQNAEWGYISFNELKDVRAHGVLHVDCELEHYWKVRKSSEVLEDYAPPEYQSGR